MFNIWIKSGIEDYIDILKENLDVNLIFHIASYVKIQIYSVAYILINSLLFHHLSIITASLFKFHSFFLGYGT
jgi:hypothetical protein